MAILKSKYKAPFLYRNAHVATILPSMFREVSINYSRERINLTDGDFLDLDWVNRGNDKIVIISHGLEGDSSRHYVAGTAKLFSDQGWDAIGWNCRSCSGEMNLMPRLYSHVDAPDLAEVIEHVLSTKRYQKIALVGFSMGGAIILNYLTKMKSRQPTELAAAVVFSSPVDVGASADELEKSKNRFYLQRFMKKMIKRIKRKAEQFPEIINTIGVDEITTFTEYDIRYTAPLNGCENPAEFYKKASTYDKLPEIDISTLLVIAKNDPFMPPSCYPYEAADDHEYFHLEVPKRGGHVGFTIKSLKYSWMEGRALEFINGFS
jgi:predicted alpha/beta-fold hydrolase